MEKILLISNMYPSKKYKHYGVFVQNTASILKNNGYQVDVSALKKKDSKLGKLGGYLSFYLKSIFLCLFHHYDYLYAHYISHCALLIKIIKGMMNKENSYALLTSPNGDPSFATRISELFYRGCRPRLAQHMPGCTEEEKDAAYLFVAGGCGYLISAWMKEGMQTPPEEIADRLRKICSTFLEAYAQQK